MTLFDAETEKKKKKEVLSFEVIFCIIPQAIPIA